MSTRYNNEKKAREGERELTREALVYLEAKAQRKRMISTISICL